MSARLVSLLALTFLTTSLLPACENAQTLPAAVPVKETTPNGSEPKIVESPLITPSPTTADSSEQTLKAVAPTATIQQNKKMEPARGAIPERLIGVWSDNDANGKLQCDQYKLMIKHRRNDDELSNSLVGSLLITRHLIHAYSEYGEGNFYAVKKISQIGRSKWLITSQVSVDTLPSEEIVEELFTFQLDLDSAVLYWRNYDDKEPPEIAQDKSPGFFKCGQLPKRVAESYNDS